MKSLSVFNADNYFGWPQVVYFVVIILITCVTACKPEEKKANLAQNAIDKAIAKHGGGRYDSLSVSFGFREMGYTFIRKDGLFSYSRHFVDSANRQVADQLTNSGFERMIDGERVDVPDEKAQAYSNSINSVAYFMLLPNGLNDAAVIKSYQGKATIAGEPYHKIEVRFTEEGGGEDYQDVFMYWIHAKQHTLDYLAYSFIENDGGTRFRRAINRREIGGIIWQDYINYTYGTPDFALSQYDQVLDSLEELSQIVNTNVVVK